MLALVGLLHLGPPLLALLFSYFALRKLQVLAKRKWFALILFVVVAAAIVYAAGHFARIAIHALPEVVENSISSSIAWAQEREIELPFTDLESLKAYLVTTLREEAHYLGNAANFARSTTTGVVFALIGIVCAVSLFFNSRIDIQRQANAPRNNFYSVLSDEITERFRNFYQSFATVMGAQITISLINTALTAIFVLVVGLPHAALVIALTFLCGLLPIVGNLVSNTAIVFIAFTISIKMALFALIFLIGVHKLRVLSEQQDHWRSHSKSNLVDLDRAHYRRTIDGHPGNGPRAGRIKLPPLGTFKNRNPIDPDHLVRLLTTKAGHNVRYY